MEVAQAANLQPLLVLGLETSCDETAAAVVELGPDGSARILSDIIYSQHEAHAPWRGVVPEIAARAHVEVLDRAVAAAMQGAGLDFVALDGIAATAGPGLIGGVMVGLVTAKAIALAANKPLIAVNHLEGHALSPRLSGPAPFPYLLLLVSGGHCQFLAVEGLGRYRRLGTTIDDAAGEAFDKAAKVLGLGFPGGPALERAATAGDASRFALPRPLLGRPGCDFSFAGLKTAVLREYQRLDAPSGHDVADLAAGFQAAVLDVVRDRTEHAMALYEQDPRPHRLLVAAGGVSANQALRGVLEQAAHSSCYAFRAPPLRHCTDNAAMIALAGAERLRAGFSDSLEAPARPRWPLDEAAAQLRASHQAGRKGAKA